VNNAGGVTPSSRRPTAPDVPIGIWIVDVDPVAQTVTVETRIGDHSTFDVCAVEDFL